MIATHEQCGKHGCTKEATHIIYGSLVYYACDAHAPEIREANGGDRDLDTRITA